MSRVVSVTSTYGPRELALIAFKHSPNVIGYRHRSILEIEHLPLLNSPDDDTTRNQRHRVTTVGCGYENLLIAREKIADYLSLG